MLEEEEPTCKDACTSTEENSKMFLAEIKYVLLLGFSFLVLVFKEIYVKKSLLII